MDSMTPGEFEEFANAAKSHEAKCLGGKALEVIADLKGAFQKVEAAYLQVQGYLDFFKRMTEWRPASAPPDNDRTVLVWMYGELAFASYDKAKGSDLGWYTDECFNVPVTHWTEAPKGPSVTHGGQPI